MLLFSEVLKKPYAAILAKNLSMISDSETPSNKKADRLNHR